MLCLRALVRNMCSFAVALALGLCGAASQALEYRVAGTLAYVTGEVFSDDLGKFERLLRRNPNLKTLVLLDVPGSADDATNVEIIRLIRENGLTTHLTSESHVASGGTDLFLGGVVRTMELGARIGVHSWSDGETDGSAFARDSFEHDMMLDLYEDIGISEDFYWFTLEAAPAAGMHYMSVDEVERFGLVTQGSE